MIKKTGDTTKQFFYNGTVCLEFDPILHAYYLEEDGVRYLVAGATSVCAMIDKSGPLMPWAAKMVVEYIKAKTVFQFDEIRFTNAEGNPVIGEEGFDSFLLEAKKNYKSLSETALDIGTLAHDWLEAYTKALINKETFNAPLPANDKAIFCIEAALKWQNEHNFRPISAEQKVYSKKLNCAGTFDWVAVIDACDNPLCCKVKFKDKVALGDYKSSKAIYDEYRIQTSFYKLAVEEENDFRYNAYVKGEASIATIFNDYIDIRVILRLGKDDGEFESLVLTEESDYDMDLTAFEGALAIYTWMQQLKINEKAEKQRLKELKPKKEVKRRIKLPQIAMIPVVDA